MATSIEQRLDQMGIVLPPPPGAVAAYEPWMRAGNLVMTSGQLPWQDGVIAYAGKLGAELNEEQGYQAARLCALNAIAQINDAIGDLEKLKQFVRIEGYVHAAPGFRGHPQVLNGASDLISELFGERGRHARLALGINEMPLDAAVQLTVTVVVED
ncbi:MAG: RidA family protein [Planctomycetota bacterium]